MTDLRLGNSIELLKDIPSESIDCIITDVPYKTTSRGSSGSMGGYWKGDLAKSGRIFDDNDVKPSEYLPDFYRVLKDGTHCYIMINNINLIEMLNEATSVGFRFIKSLIWDKCSKITGRWYMGCYEYILMFRKGEGRPINYPSTPDLLQIPICKLKLADGSNAHDTQKPDELFSVLVRNSTNKGETVLDPFMGIGGCGVACQELERNFIGMEINPTYYNIAKARIDGASVKGEAEQGEQLSIGLCQ